MVDISKYQTGSYASYNRLEKNYGYFFLKIISDHEMTDLNKNICLETICSITASDEVDFQEKCEAYFNKNKLKGSSVLDITKKNPFVRIHSKDAFISQISQIIGVRPSQLVSNLTYIIYNSDAKVRSLLLNSLLNSLAVNDSYMREENCLKFFGQKKWKSKTPPKLKDAFILNYKSIQWSFPKPVKEDIFADQNSIEKLPCRAGLTDSNKKIIFLYKLSDSYNVRKPTTLDAGFYEQFEPGGKTKPLSKCAPLLGFEEVVHIPNIFFNLENQFYEVFKS